MAINEVISTWAPPALRIIAVIVVTWVGAHLSRRLVKRAPQALRRQLDYFAPKAVWALGFIVLLGSVGVNIGSLLALMATLGIGAALVFTPVGQNLIAGFLAGIDDVVRMGDVIEVGGKVGTVVRTGSLSVGVEFPDGSVVYMPNVKAVDDELTNHSRTASARISVEVKLDGTPDRKRAVEVMTKTLEGLPWRLQDKPVTVRFTEIGANALHFECNAWIDHRIQAPARQSDMLTALVDALDEAGISVGETNNMSASDFVVRGGSVPTAHA